MGTGSYAQLGKLSAVLFILPSTMGGGWVLGHYAVDSWMGTFPWGGIAGTALGAAAGFYEIFRLLTRDVASDRRGPRP